MTTDHNTRIRRHSDEHPFSRALASYRHDAGLSQTALAALMPNGTSGAHQRNISRWETGHLTNPAPKTGDVRNLEIHLGVPSGELARHIGYMWVDAGAPASVVQAVAQDPGLDEESKKLLLNLYRKLKTG